MNAPTRHLRMKTLWTRMQAFYGSRWNLDYGELEAAEGELAPVAGIWADALEGASNEHIKRGLKALLARESDHPPSLPEFLRLCGATVHARSQPTETRVTLDPAAYAETPASRCAALAATLAEQAQQDLDPRLDRAADPKQRANIIRAYWMTQIGATDIGKRLARNWEQETA